MAEDTMNYTPDWNYAGLTPERSGHLSRCPPYCEIIRQLVDRIEHVDIDFHLDEGRHFPVDGALRPLFYVDVGDDLADWFFNGANGYRAQYYASPANGLAANRYALGKLERTLLSAARNANFQMQNPNDHTRELIMSEAAILTSLRMPSAKIWGDETEGGLHDVAAVIQDITPQVLAVRWMKNATAGADKARKGIKTPRFKTLKFHGAFLKDDVEQVPLDKVSRSEDIYFWGFS